MKHYLEGNRDRNLKVAFIFIILLFLLFFVSAEVKEKTSVLEGPIILEDNVSNLTITTYNNTWLEFDGEDDYVEIENMDWNFDNKNRKTISVWFNAKNTTNSQGIISFGDSERAIDFYINDGGIGTIQYKNYADSIDYSTLDFDYDYGSWNNLIVVWNGSTYKSFLNGEQKYRDTLDLYPAFENNMAVGRFIENNFYLKGGIDDIIIINRSINDLEVKDFYYSRNGFYKYSINKTPLSRFYEPIYLENSSNIYGFDSGKLYKSTNNGDSFQLLFDFSDTGVYSSREFWKSKAEDYYLGLDKTGKIAVSIGNDKNWTYVEPFVCDTVSEGGPSTLWFIDEDSLGNLYMGEYGGNEDSNCAFIHKSTDKGLTWNIAYNSSDYGWDAEHMHIVGVNPENDYIYATQGDGISKARLIRSIDYGETWTTLQEGVGEAQYTTIVFTDNYRIFGTDHDPNKIVRTSDDVNFETVYSVPETYEAYFWKMVKDRNTGYIYAGVVTTNTGNSAYLLISPDNGDSWFTVETNLDSASNHRGYREISDFGEDGYAYLSDSSDEFISYKFNLIPVKKRGDLIGEWKINENSGATIYDSSGNNNHGIIYGATWDNDGVLKELKQDNDYWFNQETGELLVSGNYLYSWINATYETSSIFNYSIPEFEKLMNMPESLDQHSMEACGDYLWVVGGRSFNDHSDRTYRYDPSEDEWTRMKDAPYNSQSAVLRCYNDKKLYYIGGHNSETREIFNYNYEYDIDSDSWTRKADMLYGVEDMGSAIYGDSIYLFGGLQTMEPVQSSPKDFTQMYNITSDSWEYKADMPDKKWSGDFAAESEGLVYLIGSTNTFKDYPNLTQVPIVYVYNIKEDQYSQMRNITLGVCYKEAEELDGLIYVFGGSDDTQDRGTDHIQIYNIIEDVWELSKTRLPYSARGIAMAKLNRTIYMSGGATNKGAIKYDEFYKINFNSNNSDPTINDTTPPRITGTYPTDEFAKGTFEVGFIEENPKKVQLVYGNETDLIGKVVELDSCEKDGDESYCVVEVNLSYFDEQEIIYYFYIEDVAGNYDESEKVNIDVDLTAPRLNNLDYSVGFRKVSFTFNITEPNFNKITYKDFRYGEIERTGILCWELKNGICSRTKWLRAGNHTFKIEILDRAGNINSFELESILV